MAYDKHTWTCDEPITVEKLNHMEDGIEAADCGFECTTETEVTFFNGSITTAESGGVVIGEFTPSQAINTDTLTVTFNGTEYVLPKIEQYGSIYYGEVSGGSPVFTNYPCYIIADAGRFVTENAGTFTVKMEGAIESVTATECFGKAVKLFTLEHLLDGEADGSLRSNISIPEGSEYTLGEGAVALGDGTTASGYASHAEGLMTTASGNDSHAEGLMTTASGNESHAEGLMTTASGYASHAEGGYSTASGNNSHAEGEYTTANHRSQHVFGEYNVEDPSTAAATAKGTYIEIVGCGKSNTERSNARTLDWNGNEVLKGSLTLGSTTLTEAQLIQLLALLN